MNNNTLKKLIKEEIRSILNEGEHDQQNYMFFQNLHTIKRMVEKMLALNPQEVDSLLSNGHAWAVDHISTSADDVGEVGTWLCNELGYKSNNMMTESNSNNEVINLNLESYLAPRKEACKKFNELFGLEGDKAIDVNIAIMRAFIALKQFALTNTEIICFNDQPISIRSANTFHHHHNIDFHCRF